MQIVQGIYATTYCDSYFQKVRNIIILLNVNHCHFQIPGTGTVTIPYFILTGCNGHFTTCPVEELK